MRSNVEAAQSAWNARTPSAGRSDLAGTNFVPWLRGLAENGGKGVVNNIDARCLGRIADEIDRLQEAKRRALKLAVEHEHNVNALMMALKSASAQCGNVIYNCEQKPADNQRHLSSWCSVKAFIDTAIRNAAVRSPQESGPK